MTLTVDEPINKIKLMTHIYVYYIVTVSLPSGDWCAHIRNLPFITRIGTLNVNYFPGRDSNAYFLALCGSVSRENFIWNQKGFHKIESQIAQSKSTL